MADIRCPMCGKPNSEELDTCQFCQARLKPLISPSQGEPERQDWQSAFDTSADFESSEDSDWIDDGSDATDIEIDSDESLDRLDWLSSTEKSSPTSPPEPLRPEALESAGADLAADSHTSSEETPAEDDSEQVDLSAWLASLDEGEERPPKEAIKEELPDWLVDELRIDKDKLASAETSDEENLEPADLPDWLKAIGPIEEPEAEQPVLQTPEHPPEEVEPLEELPDWLAELEGDELKPEPEQDPGVEGTQSEVDLPDWLAELEGEASSETGELAITEEAISAEPEELPDWLTKLDAPTPEEDLGSVYTAELGTAGIPDWLAEIEELETSGLGGEVDDEHAGAEEAIDIPDWLSEHQQEGVTDIQEAAVTSELSTEWLSEISTEMPGDEKPETIPEDQAGTGELAIPFALDEDFSQDLDELNLAEVPDWLDEVTDQTSVEDVDETDESPDLARAELPGWLEAMRPVGAVVTPQTPVDEDGQEYETAGPLAGLRDVLPAEVGVIPLSKPETLSVTLDVNESQQKHISLLEGLLATEEEPGAVPAQTIIGAQRLLRILIAVILIAVVYLGVRGASQDSELPIPPLEVTSASRLIDNLGPQAPVLLAFDYEPGFSGEMDTISESVIAHLMLRGAYLTLVSTTPTGPFLAERFLDRANQTYNYTRDQKYVNLGFLPGGSTGLQGLVRYPMRLAFPYKLDGWDPWGDGETTIRQPALVGVENLSDYDLVVIITDRQESARNWIEQVGANPSQPPLLMITSAQLEAFVRPYYQSTPQVVEGFVSGLSGGGAYERLSGLMGSSRLFWDAYGAAALAAVVLILAGVILNLLWSAFAGNRQSKGEPTNEPA